MLLAYIVNGAFWLAVLAALFAAFRYGTRIERRACIIGMVVATVLAVAWQLEAIVDLHLSFDTYFTLHKLTLFVCPSSFMLMEVDPLEPVSLDVLVMYFIAIAANGGCYAFVALIVRKMWALGKNAPA